MILAFLSWKERDNTKGVLIPQMFNKLFSAFSVDSLLKQETCFLKFLPYFRKTCVGFEWTISLHASGCVALVSVLVRHATSFPGNFFTRRRDTGDKVTRDGLWTSSENLRSAVGPFSPRFLENIFAIPKGFLAQCSESIFAGLMYPKCLSGSFYLLTPRQI